MPRSSFLKRNDNIIKFHKQIQINIGLIIFGIIFIYVLFHIFSYMTSDNITVYEVQEGTIAQNYIYQALAVRSRLSTRIVPEIFFIMHPIWIR